MSDRILRDELWLSDRFLDLPTDIARLAFLRFLSLADDFGNFEGGIRRLARILHACTQSKTDEAIAQTLDALMAADLIRCYQAEGRDLIHIPRFRSKRWYFARKVPASPWCDASTPLGKEERAQKQEHTQKVDTTLSQRCSHVAEGVGVGVGVGEEISTSNDVDCPRPADDGPTSGARIRIPDCPHQAVLSLWGEVLPSMPQHDPGQWRGSRADHLRARWRETAVAKGWASQADGLTYLRKLFAYVGTSPFLTGREHGRDRRPFHAELAWLVAPMNWAKVHEGKYHPEKERT